MSIEVQGVGHVVLKVADLEPALAFYRDVLGLREVARNDFGDGPMVFLSTGRTHHDIGLVAVGAGARRPEGGDIGLYHVALKIGDDLDALRAAKAQSIYVADPDGNNIELYVDADPAIWHDDPATVATATELNL